MGGGEDFSLYFLENVLLQEGSGHGNCRVSVGISSSS
jgi:hypothetical protein